MYGTFADLFPPLRGRDVVVYDSPGRISIPCTSPVCIYFSTSWKNKATRPNRLQLFPGRWHTIYLDLFFLRIVLGFKSPITIKAPIRRILYMFSSCSKHLKAIQVFLFRKFCKLDRLLTMTWPGPHLGFCSGGSTDRMKKAHVTHPELKMTFCLEIASWFKIPPAHPVGYSYVLLLDSCCTGGWV